MSLHKSCTCGMKLSPIIEYDMVITKMTMLTVTLCIINEYIYEWLMSFHKGCPFCMKFGPVIGNDMLI